MYNSIESKAFLRKKYLNLRSEFSDEEVFELSNQIFHNFILQFNPIENQKVHVFQSIPKFHEVNTEMFINYFFEKNIRVFVPKIMGDKMITIEIFPDTKHEVSSWGISEPETNLESSENSFDFVITPLIYCDHLGNRIGHGKGYYDQFFAKINPSAKRIGVNFFKPNEIIGDVSVSDVPLNYLVLPMEVLSFAKDVSTFTK